MRSLWYTVREIIQGGLLRGWPGARCPNCKAKPGKPHEAYCPQLRYGKDWA